MLLERGLKDMESKISIHFNQENVDIELDFEQPDLSLFVKKVLAEHLKVTDSNIQITSTVEGFDTKEFTEILVSVHEEFEEELNQFFKNIENEVSTFYDDDLSTEIISRIKEIH